MFAPISKIATMPKPAISIDKVLTCPGKSRLGYDVDALLVLATSTLENVSCNACSGYSCAMQPSKAQDSLTS